MRLKAREAADLKTARGTLTQRVTGTVATATVCMEFAAIEEGNTAGFGIFESPYAYLAIKQMDGQRALVACLDGKDTDSINVPQGTLRVWFRVNTTVQEESVSFAYSWDGRYFIPFGQRLKMGLGLPWTANRYALFCFEKEGTPTTGYADFDMFEVK